MEHLFPVSEACFVKSKISSIHLARALLSLNAPRNIFRLAGLASLSSSVLDRSALSSDFLSRRRKGLVFLAPKQEMRACVRACVFCLQVHFRLQQLTLVYSKLALRIFPVFYGALNVNTIRDQKSPGKAFVSKIQTRSAQSERSKPASTR